VRRVTLAAIALLALAAAPAGAVTQRTSLSAIEPQVMCVTCEIPLVVAESPAADQERQFISHLVAQGDTAAQVKRALVAQYGEGVLALPPDRGFNVAFYLIPVAVVAVALALVALLLPRWRRNRRENPPAGGGAGTPPETAGETARLDADLARFDV
jgi:cytochrome c-type biogenesis protein CcmH